MKLKRFLALAVSLAMVLAMVPAFSLTASAAGTTGVINALGGEVLWSCPDGSFSDTAVATAWSGWDSTTANGTYANLRTYGPGNTLQFYHDNTNNDLSATVTAPGYGDGEDAIVIEWTHKCQIAAHASGDLYMDFSFRDLNGTEIAFVALDKNTSDITGNYKLGYPAEGADMAIVAYNNADGSTHTVEYYVNGSVVNTESAVAGTINGFKSIVVTGGRWSKTWNHIGFANLTIGAVSFSASRVDVEASYTVNGEVVKTETGHYDPAEGETGVTFPAFEYSANGSNVMYVTEGATLSESGTIEMAAVANPGHAVGDVVAVGGVQYEIKGANLVPNGDFSRGLVGWYNSAGNNASSGNFTANDDGTVHAGGHTGSTGADSLYRGWAVEAGKQYLFTFTSSTTNEYLKVSNMDAVSTSDSGNVGTGVTGTNNMIFTAAEFENGESYLVINFRWLGSNTTLGHFGLYEIQEAEVAVQETVASVAEIAPVKVIGDTAVVLPSTVAVTGSLGSEIDAPIVWDAPATYEVGTTTVEGTATVKFGEQEATTETVSTTVTVLEETFTLSDITTVNGQDAGKASQVMFPVALTGEFNMEFTANYASFGDLWITIKNKDAGFFSPEQIPLGVNASGAFRPVNGNGSGGRAVADSDLAYLTAGTAYRFFITTDASTDKYTVTIYDEATGAEVVTAENFGYRTNADAIECITSLTNNGNGSVTLTNIKVNAPGVSKTEYTFNITKDGETSTTTASFWSDEEALNSIADIEGYEKTVSIEGTVVTVVYSATKEITVTFVTADETVIYSVTEEVELDEALTVAETEIYDAVTCAYYTIPETVAEASKVVEVAVNADKIAVVADAFHNSSDAQPWNNDENKLFVGSAGATNLDDVDANGERVTSQGNNSGNLGSGRVALVKFPVPEVAENKAVKLHLYVAELNGNLGIGNNMKLAANVSEVEANEVENAYVAADLVWKDGLVWSDNFVTQSSTQTRSGVYACDEWVEIDVTNFVKAATGDTITFALYAPTAGAYVADREKAVAGGAYQGKAAYLSLEDAFVVTETGFATLTKNGTAMTTAYAVAGDDVRLIADGAVVVNTDAGYYEANKNLNLTEAVDFENTVPAGLGLAMVDGAQVRIGATELEAGEKLDALADSGLRFIATADYTDTVILDDAVEFGIKVTAEGSSNVAYVKAENFQNEDNNVFSAAITNMNESNYNRKYTASAYALVPMADGSTLELTAGEVTRSIYQVSAGIMKNGSADADNAAYTVDGVVKNILNAYVNQTGIRLSYTADGIAVEEGKYTGDVFFTVECVSDGDDGFNVTITPDTSWGTPAEIADWWTDYVRFNNNNSVAKGYISANYYINSDPVFVHTDGTLTFNFDTTDDGTGGFDGEEIPLG